MCVPVVSVGRKQNQNGFGRTARGNQEMCKSGNLIILSLCSLSIHEPVYIKAPIILYPEILKVLHMVNVGCFLHSPETQSSPGSEYRNSSGSLAKLIKYCETSKKLNQQYIGITSNSLKNPPFLHCQSPTYAGSLKFHCKLEIFINSFSLW